MGVLSACLLPCAALLCAISAFVLGGMACEGAAGLARAVKVRERMLEDAQAEQGYSMQADRMQLVRRRLSICLQALPSAFPLKSVLERAVERHASSSRDIAQELPYALDNISAALSVGQSSRQAFAYAAQNARGALSYMLYRVVWDLEAGLGLRAALESLASKSRLSEMEFVCAAFLLQQKSGGSMVDVLEHAIASLRSSFEFERSMRVQTSQARLSAKVVGIVPFALLAVLAVLSPDYITCFFTSPLGFALFITALALDAIGLALIRRIVSVGVR